MRTNCGNTTLVHVYTYIRIYVVMTTYIYVYNSEDQLWEHYPLFHINSPNQAFEVCLCERESVRARAYVCVYVTMMSYSCPRPSLPHFLRPIPPPLPAQSYDRPSLFVPQENLQLFLSVCPIQNQTVMQKAVPRLGIIDTQIRDYHDPDEGLSTPG